MSRLLPLMGQMMDAPLSIITLLQYAARCHATTEIVSRNCEGTIHRYGYGAAYDRVQALANGLVSLKVAPGDRVATLAWNNHRHFELYFAISGMGAVCHTINPRLAADQMAYILNHAEDEVLFVDPTFVPLVARLQGQLPHLRHVVVMTDRAHMPETPPGFDDLLCYEELIAGQPASYDWPDLDERTASSLCYTSGTTGKPKGVLYSHRSTVLHAMAAGCAEGVGVSGREVVLPVVPLFHVNAWGIPYACAMFGAKLVLPGPRLDGEGLHELFEAEGVTLTAGVPTVWLNLINYLRQSGKRLDMLKSIVIGGSAAPVSMIRTFEEEFGVDVAHAWGMTEMSPMGTIGILKRKDLDRPAEERYALKATQGRMVAMVGMKIVDPMGRALPHDGTAFGELLVSGPWITSGYYHNDEANLAAFDEDGWFRTGDVATIDADGYMHIVDRAKDVIKSGGEWISSIDLENAVMGHPKVAEAAVIGVAHPKWDERPLLIVVPKPGETPDKDEILSWLTSRVARLWLPDDVVLVDELPHSGTGKVLKAQLRQIFKDHKLPTA
ncbi:long-chain-fatty-acid--CoA ligase [Tistrella bauzanensis]|uniref:Long-chain-fatty-acid--CoA ligase n=1 Tax=Tistrella arctica TaxID=3133430 RepID=A0ABU9YSS5_9PROT